MLRNRPFAFYNCVLININISFMIKSYMIYYQENKKIAGIKPAIKIKLIRRLFKFLEFGF